MVRGGDSSTRALIAIALVISILFASACSGSSGSSESAVTASVSTPSTTSSAVAAPDPTLPAVDLDGPSDPSVAARLEHELVVDLRDGAGFAALVGDGGDAAFTTFDALGEAYVATLITELGPSLADGELPTDAETTGVALRAPPGALQHSLQTSAPGPVQPSMVSDTGFSTSLLLTMMAGATARAGTTASATLPRSETFDRTEGGLRHQVDLGTTFTVRTGGGRVDATIIMTATDRISNAATGAFVALYTSRTEGHFDTSACPDEAGVAEGTYTFETKHELNDVSGAQAARSGGARTVDAPFRMIDGDDAHLVRIEATMDLEQGAFGPGSPSGPGPTGPFDWTASEQTQVVLTRSGSPTLTSAGASVSGTGGEHAAGSGFFSAAMTSLFLIEVGKHAEAFWRSGECIDVTTTEDSRTVDAGETVTFDADAKGRFDGEAVDAPLTATFSGKASLDPVGEAQDPPASLTFVAGGQVGDTGTIALEQVSVRGIGRKSVTFEVAASDYRWPIAVPSDGIGAAPGLGVKCDGWVGTWSGVHETELGTGTETFTFTEGSPTGQVTMVLDYQAGAATVHQELAGTVTFVDGEQPYLSYGALALTTTVTAAGVTATNGPVQVPPLDVLLEVGDFCP